MFRFVWNYLKGYVIIEIKGFSIERFINLCLHKNITMADLQETKNGVSCKVYIKDFKKLKSISRKTGCKYKIISKYGMPFTLFRNRKRKLFFIGIISFVIILYFLSSFIWSINVVGSKYVDNNEILRFCEENGLHLGTFKRNINPKELQTQIKNNFDKISWVSVQVDGTVVTIKVSESIPDDKNDENIITVDEAYDIVADETGVITEIVTRNGTPLVKAKDVVEKGDILVSGQIFLKEGEEIKGSYTVTSDADIRAKIKKDIVVEVPFEYYIKDYTGKSKSEYSLLAFNKNFSLNLKKTNISYENYDTITSRTQLKLTENLLLPFIFKKTQYREYIPTKRTYSIEEAKSYANKLLTQKVTEEIDFQSDILDKSVSYEETADKIIATLSLTLIQNIGQKSLIDVVNIERSNTEDGTNETTNSQ